MTIRKAESKDIDFIIDVGKKTKEFTVDENYKGIFWREKDLEKWFQSPSDVCLVAEEDEEVKGFIFFAIHKPTSKAILENVWVSPNSQKQGIASKLFEEGLKLIKEKGATYLCSFVHDEAIGSIKFHLKNGFKQGLKFNWFHKFL